MSALPITSSLQVGSDATLVPVERYAGPDVLYKFKEREFTTCLHVTGGSGSARPYVVRLQKLLGDETNAYEDTPQQHVSWVARFGPVKTTVRPGWLSTTTNVCSTFYAADHHGQAIHEQITSSVLSAVAK